MKPIARGYVLSVARKTFWWRFKTASGFGVPHDGQVRIDQLSQRERPFLAPGAYLDLLRGGTFRFSRARWKKRDIERAKKRAHRLFTSIFNPLDRKP